MIDPHFWQGRRVLITGHTGFKGAWLCLLLRALGAEVFGFALAPDNEEGIFSAARVADDINHTIGDIRSFQEVRACLASARPSIVIHMAAQSLVRRSYAAPVETYATNVMGTVHLLEAVRETPSVKAVVVVTSDKCYENVGWVWGYREVDRLGGHDPYSNSKACAELVTSAYRRSFLADKQAPAVASARAGNVVGGGDWAPDRLLPDAIRSFSEGAALEIRNPHAVRPWQHVFDPLIGYLCLAEHLAQQGAAFAEGWNFGPSSASEVSVERVVEALVGLWGAEARWHHDDRDHPQEAAYLKLDCSKAETRLGWRPLVSLEQALELAIAWHRAQQKLADMRAVSLGQIEVLLDRATAVRAQERPQVAD